MISKATEVPASNNIISVEAEPMPEDLPSAPMMDLSSGIDEGGAREYLSTFNWPTGLQDTFIQNLTKVPIRFFICDDSGSMMAEDGKKLVKTNGTFKSIKCSRWNELTETIKFHAGLASASKAITEFRLLNAIPPIRLGLNDSEESQRNTTLRNALNQSPSGGTPLCQHVREVGVSIRSMKDELKANGQKAFIIIATDGCSSDGDIANVLRPLRDLPVWVVIRLCTDEDHIVHYWNNIDNELELNMDVLDDLFGEAKEISEKNPWLTYAEPLQRIREFGITAKELDMLEETKLSLDQIRSVCKLIFGGNVDDFPHPAVDWEDFSHFIEQKNKENQSVYNPVLNKVTPWVNTHLMKKSNQCRIM